MSAPMRSRDAHGAPERLAPARYSAIVPAVLRLLITRKWMRHLLLLLAMLAALPAARAEIRMAAESEQSQYVRGQINTFVFNVTLYSEVTEYADNIHFHLPAGLSVSAVRQTEVTPNCPDSLLLVLGMGTDDGGWFNPGYPSLCGYFTSSSSGVLQTLELDIDIPTDYVGDLPITVVVDGDQCCDPPPHGGSITLIFVDTASPVVWTFDDVIAPQLPANLSAVALGGGTAWITSDEMVNTAPNAIHAPAPDHEGESILTTAPIAIDPSGGTLRFKHSFDIEDGHDGGVLEMAIDDGSFKDIIEAGGDFESGAYNSRIDANDVCNGSAANPLLGRTAWNGLQQAFVPVAVTLPKAVAGHLVRFRWRLGTDCNGPAPVANNGWWIDDVTIVASAPVASIGPDSLDLVLDTASPHSEALFIGNPGGEVLSYAVISSEVPWLHVANPSGQIEGGAHVDVTIDIDTAKTTHGDHTAELFVVTMASAVSVRPIATEAIQVHLQVVAACDVAGDRVFHDGFEGAPEPTCGSLRVFSRREVFLAEVADGHATDDYTGLRSGVIHGPIYFGNSTFPYSVSTQDNPLNSALFLYAGTGVLSTNSSADQVTLTFLGEPVTALGGDFSGEFLYGQRSLVVPATISLMLDDKVRETFSSDTDDRFRGFISSRPIHSLSVISPDIDPIEQDAPSGVVDNVVVGQRR